MLGVWELVVARMLAQEQGARVMGTVATKDALVTGGLEVKGDRARLMSNTSVTAYDHTAQVKLERGGDVLVCATSQFHLLAFGWRRSRCCLGWTAGRWSCIRRRRRRM